MMSMGAVAVNSDTPKTEESLQGAWQLSRGEAEGKALTKEQIKDGKLVIEDDRYTVTLAGMEKITGTQKLDPTQKLKSIDITDASGSSKGKTSLGIYKIERNEFHVVFAQPGKARPTKFATLPDSGQWMHVWDRVKQ